MTSPARHFQSNYKDSKEIFSMADNSVNKYTTLNGLLRVYRYKNSKSPKLELIVYNASLTNKLIDLNKKYDNYRATVEISGDVFIVSKSPFGNRFYPRTKNQFSTLPLAKIINLQKKYELGKLIQDNKNYYSKRVEVKVNPTDWNLEHYEMFSESPEERELVKKLSSIFQVDNITANPKNSKRYGNADLLVTYKCQQVPIEITTSQPSKQKKEVNKGCNAPHGARWSKLASKILTLLIYTIENNFPSVVIIPDEWRPYTHTLQLQKSLQNNNCFIIYSSFKDNWAEIVTEKLCQILSDKKCYVSELNRQHIPSRAQLLTTSAISYQTKKQCTQQLKEV